MSRTLKWVLGILAVLVVIAIIAGGVWVWQNHAQFVASSRPYAVQPKPNAQGTPGVPNSPNGPRGYGFNGNGRGPMNGWGFRGPMMGGRGRNMMPFFGPFGMGFFFLGGLLRLFVPLVILVVVAIVFYQLGKRAGIRTPTRPEPAPATPADQNSPRT
jgi:hypothetical protein